MKDGSANRFGGPQYSMTAHRLSTSWCTEGAKRLTRRKIKHDLSQEGLQGLAKTVVSRNWPALCPRARSKTGVFCDAIPKQFKEIDVHFRRRD